VTGTGCGFYPAMGRRRNLELARDVIENVVEVRVELEDVGGRTTVIMTHAGIPADSPGAAGWATAFDKLAAHIDARPQPIDGTSAVMRRHPERSTTSTQRHHGCRSE
jgi:hypothetical protein